jgi:hypothetical protein
LSDDRLSVPLVSIPETPLLSKRQIASHVAKVYDPFGISAPFTISAKIMLQKLWSLKMGWDDPIKEPLVQEVNQSLRILQKASTLSVDRFLLPSYIEPGLASLHLFCDASPQAFSCVLYLKPSPEAIPLFILSKARVAPLKQLTLPRLELMSCLIGARLLSRFLKCSGLDIPSFAWTDSKIALGWIGSEPNLWNIFVSNRVSEIQTLAPTTTWSHVSGVDNPSDWSTRSNHFPKSERDTCHWLHGPSWLSLSRDHWPTSFDISVIEDLPESKGSTTSLLTPSSKVEPSIFGSLRIEKYSSLEKLLRVCSYALRFSDRSGYTGFPEKEELQRTLRFLIKRIQMICFHDEMMSSLDGTRIPPTSPLVSLKPVLGCDGVLRSIGRTQRIEHSDGLIILPSKNHLSDLIIMEHHKKEVHGWIDITLSSLRSKYWVIHGRQNVKRVLQACPVCKWLRAQPYVIPESPLPLDRITMARPFQRCGVDFYGPMMTSDHGKVYGIIFTCCVTRAVFLDCLRSQETATLLNAIRRVEAQVGPLETIYSDNAKTFRKAAGLLRERIVWKFIPDRSPHFGGFYERLIQSVKKALRSTFRGTCVTFDCLLTALVEIQGVLNRRPLTYVGDDPSVPVPIRPVDFLHPDIPVSSHPESTSDTLRSLFAKSKSLLHSFWSRWHTEYLAQIRLWRRRFKSSSEPSVGDVVLIHEQATRNKFLFPLGIITHVNVGVDGHVRSAYVRTASGTYRRAIHLLYPLEFAKPSTSDVSSTAVTSAPFDAGARSDPGEAKLEAEHKSETEPKSETENKSEPEPKSEAEPKLDNKKLETTSSRYGRRLKRPDWFIS